MELILFLLLILRTFSYPSKVNCELKVIAGGNKDENVMTTQKTIMGNTIVSADSKLNNLPSKVCAEKVINLDISTFIGSLTKAIVQVTDGKLTAPGGSKASNCQSTTDGYYFESKPSGIKWTAPNKATTVTLNVLAADYNMKLNRAKRQIQVIANNPSDPLCGGTNPPTPPPTTKAPTPKPPTPPPTAFSAATGECASFQKTSNIGKNFVLCWTRTDSVTKMMLTRLGAAKSDWIGLGLGENMVGASVLIGSSTKPMYTGVALSKTNKDWTIKNQSINIDKGGYLYKNGALYVWMETSNINLPRLSWIIAASGSTAAGKYPFNKHPVGATVKVNQDFVSGETTKASMPRLLIVHALLMGISWFVLIPMGISMARFGRSRFPVDTDSPGWFDYHKYIQGSGITIAVCIGLPIGLVQGDHSNTYGHMAIGLVVCILGFSQPINGLFRPHKKKEPYKKRTYWEYLHKGTGYVAVTLGIVNVIIGIALAVNKYG